jgi:hypothetical protein
MERSVVRFYIRSRKIYHGRCLTWFVNNCARSDGYLHKIIGPRNPFYDLASDNMIARAPVGKPIAMDSNRFQSMTVWVLFKMVSMGIIYNTEHIALLVKMDRYRTNEKRAFKKMDQDPGFNFDKGFQEGMTSSAQLRAIELEEYHRESKNFTDLEKFI